MVHWIGNQNRNKNLYKTQVFHLINLAEKNLPRIIILILFYKALCSMWHYTKPTLFKGCLWFSSESNPALPESDIQQTKTTVISPGASFFFSTFFCRSTISLTFLGKCWFPQILNKHQIWKNFKSISPVLLCARVLGTYLSFLCARDLGTYFS